MYDEVMQLIALAKNDEAYFKRIEELKEKQLELAHVMEIAKTLGEADKHLAMARQKSETALEEGRKEAEVVVEQAKNKLNEVVEREKKLEEKIVYFKEKELLLEQKEATLTSKNKELERAIEDHRKLTALRTEEQEKAQKVKNEFESKLKQMREIAAK
jgi:hypothetical protein